jgi:hypothetical protein
MRRFASFVAQVGLIGLLLCFPRSVQAQFLVIGDDNKLQWNDAGKPVFTEPGKGYSAE